MATTLLDDDAVQILLGGLPPPRDASSPPALAMRVSFHILPSTPHPHALSSNSHTMLSLTPTGISEWLALTSADGKSGATLIRCGPDTAGLGGLMHGALSFLLLDMSCGMVASAASGGVAMTRKADLRWRKAAPVPGVYCVRTRVAKLDPPGTQRRQVVVEGGLVSWDAYRAEVLDGRPDAAVEAFVEATIDFGVVPRGKVDAGPIAPSSL
ncbi:hypothetical protein DFJ74DRAFT_692081 [Hyaloraphidium curvatum]|nr:hypothetical protein DFJ74DRAFT_692081 [Hyaloraphidium curvatum]